MVLLGNNLIEGSEVAHLKNLGYNNTIINCKFVGENIEIGNNCTLKNVIVGSGTHITDSYMEDALIGKDCKIGPFTRVRGKTVIGDNCKVGNFVEIKNSELGRGVKASHLSYIGDAMVGDNTNVGCGVVFANYNGKTKNITIVGKKCFIGSHVTLVAPLKIEDDSYVCAGTVVTKSTDKGDFVIGRCRAEKKDNYAYYLKNKE